MSKIVRPLLGRLNQGVIFSCAIAERYSGCECFGIVITARCDIAQDKFPVLNYIPIVSLDDWLEVDGFEILHQRAISDVTGRLNSALAAASIAKSILHSQTPRQVHESFFDSPTADKKLKGAAQKFLEVVERLEALFHARRDDRTRICDIYEGYASLARGLVKELAQNRLTGYYFLPSVMPDDGARGYVALMREVSRLPRALALKIADGLENEDQQFKSHPEWMASVSFDHHLFAMPVGELPSPTIEHFLQSFSSLFGRIGLDDLEENYITTIVERRPIRAENSQ